MKDTQNNTNRAKLRLMMRFARFCLVCGKAEEAEEALELLVREEEGQRTSDFEWTTNDSTWARRDFWKSLAWKAVGDNSMEELFSTSWKLE
jgi:hypothetical protein